MAFFLAEKVHALFSLSPFNKPPPWDNWERILQEG